MSDSTHHADGVPSIHAAGRSAVCLAFLWLFLTAGLHAQQPPVPSRRIVRVPFDDLAVILNGKTDHVFLSRSDWEALQRAAARREAAQPPENAWLRHAAYDISINGTLASIDARIDVAVLAAGWQTIPLLFSDVRLLDARLDDKPAPLHRRTDGTVELLVQGSGHHRLTLRLQTMVQVSAALQSLRFRLPDAASAAWRLDVPGNVDLKGGATVLHRSYESAARRTRFELLPDRRRVSLLLSVNNVHQRNERFMTAQSLFVSTLLPAEERLDATIDLDVLHGSADRLTFDLPSPFHILSVESPHLAQWSVHGVGAVQRLELELREPIHAMERVKIAAIRGRAPGDDWSAPLLRPRGVGAHSAVVVLAAERRLKPLRIAPTDLIPLDHRRWQAASDPSPTPATRPLAVYYAPTGKYRLDARFRPPTSTLHVIPNLGLALRESEQRLTADLVLQPQGEPLQHLVLRIPPGWTVTGVDTGRGKPRRRAGGWETLGADHGRTRLLVKLAEAIPPGDSVHIVVTATRAAPPWEGGQQTAMVEFPDIRIEAAVRDGGVIAISAIDDWRLQAADIEGLQPLAATQRHEYGLPPNDHILAYEQTGAKFSAKFRVTRRTPRIAARTHAFFRIRDGVLETHDEIVVDIDQARIRTLHVALPQSVPRTVSIVSLEGPEVEASVPVDRHAVVAWKVRLAKSHRGRLRLAIDFEEPLAVESPREIDLPLPHVVEAHQESRLVAVEGDPALEISFDTAMRPIDVGEMAEATRLPGKHLIGVFASTPKAASIRARVARHRLEALPEVLVQRAQLVTHLATSGRVVSAARYRFRTKLPRIVLRLPEHARLWSASLDGDPVRPRRRGDDIVFGLKLGSSEIRSLQIVYESPGSALGRWNRIAWQAPRLWIEGRDGKVRPVPQVDLQWEVRVPTGFRLVDARGNVYLDDTASDLPDNLMLRFASWLTRTLSPVRHERAGAAASERAAEQDLASNMVEAAPQAPSADGTNDLLPQGNTVRGGAEMGGGRFAEAFGKRQEKEDSPAAPPALSTPPPGAGPPRDQQRNWALQGMRGVKIDVEGRVHSIIFRSLGESPHVDATVVDTQMTNGLAAVLATLVLVVGLLATGRPLVVRIKWVVGVWLIAMVQFALDGPLVAFRDVCHAVIIATVVLIPIWLGIGLWHTLLRMVRATGSTRSSAIVIACIVAMSWTSTALCQSRSNSKSGQTTVAPIDGRRPSAIHERSGTVIVPYDPDRFAAPSEHVLVPYARYVELWNRAHPDEPIGRLRPARPPWLVSGAVYHAVLAGTDHLELDGRITFHVASDEAVTVPLSLDRAALRSATLDGQPAALRGEATSSDKASLQLTVQGRGRHELVLQLALPIETQGGWRQIASRIPHGVATSLELEVPEKGTELRRARSDTTWNWRSTHARQKLAWSIDNDGALTLTWRPPIASDQVDRSLTCRSRSRVDVGPDGIRAVWQLALSFGQAERADFRFRIPKGFRVGRVTGKNIRGWRLVHASGGDLLQVELLKAVKEHEALEVDLVRYEALAAGKAQRRIVPRLEVEGAMLHSGTVAIRTSPLLEVHVTETRGVVRVEERPTTSHTAIPTDPESPIGYRDFRSFQFHQQDFRIALEVAHPSSSPTGTWRVLLRVGETRSAVEAELRVRPRGRPLDQARIAIPHDLKLERVEAAGLIDWSVTTRETRRVVTLFFSSAGGAPVRIALEGTLADHAPTATVDIPRFDLLDADQEQGQLVVQVDAALDLRPVKLDGLTPLLLRDVGSWLDARQRQAARVAWWFASAAYSGALQIAPQPPLITCDTLTNVRVTFQAIEETILIDYEIHRAGAQRLTWQLPATWRDADITAPKLRQWRIEPVAGAADQIRVVLELQEPVIGSYRVLIARDRPLSDGPQSVVVPRIEHAETTYRYVALENAGRDELVVDQRDGFEPIERRGRAWNRLQQRLPLGNFTLAFVDARSKEVARLQFHAHHRQLVATVGASIGLAHTTLVLDAAGAYRGSVVFKVDNRTEPWLEVHLPNHARLWSALVAGDPVKPTSGTKGQTGALRIPLVKTAPGDLDYAVVLKYGGIMDLSSPGAQVAFPIVQTVNLPVSLSNVTLYLPDEYQWLQFGGTAEHLRSERSFLKRYASYRQKQVEQLQQVAQGKDAFSATRALYNLRRLTSHPSGDDEQDMWNDTSNASAAQNRTRALARRALQAAQSQQQAAQSSLGGQTGNRAHLEELVQQQDARQVGNEVLKLKGRFRAAPSKRSNAHGGPPERGRNKNAATSEGKNDRGMAEQRDGKLALDLALGQPAEGKAQHPQSDTGAALQRAYQGKLARGQTMAGAGPPQTAAPENQLGEEEGPNGLAVSSGGFASLDIAIPRRGRAYYFTIPRGDVTITSRPIPADWPTRAGIFVIALLLAALLWRTDRSRGEGS